MAQEILNKAKELKTLVKEGNPKVIITKEAQRWGAECIFVGALGHRVFNRLLIGSVSSAIAARAHCSVEIVRKEKDGK